MTKVSEVRRALRRMALTKAAALTPLARRFIVQLVQSGALRQATCSNLEGVVRALHARTSGARVLGAFDGDVTRIKSTARGSAFEREMRNLVSSKAEPAYQDALRAIEDRIRLAADGVQYAPRGPVWEKLYAKGLRLGRALNHRNIGDDVSIIASRLSRSAQDAGDKALSGISSAVAAGARTAHSAIPSQMTEILRMFTNGAYRR